MQFLAVLLISTLTLVIHHANGSPIPQTLAPGQNAAPGYNRWACDVEDTSVIWTCDTWDAEQRKCIDGQSSLCPDNTLCINEVRVTPLLSARHLG